MQSYACPDPTCHRGLASLGLPEAHTCGGSRLGARGGQAMPALLDALPGLCLAEGGQVSPSPASPRPFGLGHLVSGATQQLCRNRVALTVTACVYLLSLYGTSLPSKHPDPWGP